MTWPTQRSTLKTFTTLKRRHRATNTGTQPTRTNANVLLNDETKRQQKSSSSSPRRKRCENGRRRRSQRSVGKQDTIALGSRSPRRTKIRILTPPKRTFGPRQNTWQWRNALAPTPHATRPPPSLVTVRSTTRRTPSPGAWLLNAAPTLKTWKTIPRCYWELPWRARSLKDAMPVRTASFTLGPRRYHTTT